MDRFTSRGPHERPVGISRRAALRGGAALAALAGGPAFVPGSASAQAPAAPGGWPARPITFVVPFPAGGGTDTFARPLAAQMEGQLNGRIVIDNRGGAGGTVGASVAAKAPPDGYSFFIGAAHHAIAPALYPRLDYDIGRDFVPVGIVAQPPQVVVVNPQKVQARTLADFIAFAKANPRKLNFASAGNGTTHHLAGELFKLLTGTDIVHVPYRGAGPAMQDLVAGQVDVMFDGLGSSAAQIASGQIRALALAAPRRAAAFPDLPTAAEAGLQGYDVATWYALFAPRNTPPAIVERMANELRTALKAPGIVEAWRRNGSEIPDLYGDALGAFVRAEVERWGRVVREANIRLE